MQVAHRSLHLWPSTVANIMMSSKFRNVGRDIWITSMKCTVSDISSISILLSSFFIRFHLSVLQLEILKLFSPKQNSLIWVLMQLTIKMKNESIMLPISLSNNSWVFTLQLMCILVHSHSSSTKFRFALSIVLSKFKASKRDLMMKVLKILPWSCETNVSLAIVT